ncbi:MAG: dehydratase [Chloroflexi bacterium]|nr:MAG: dehydratase [Chloroflexota bacterium]
MKETMTLQARGMYFEEFEVGYRVQSPGRTITETDVVTFAGLSGDYNELHTNEVYARGEQFGARVAHGLLGLSIASGLALRLGFLEGTVLAFLSLEWKFRRPIYIGDTIHVTAEVASTRPMRRAGGGIVDFDVAVINQDGETVQKGQWRVLIRSRNGE